LYLLIGAAHVPDLPLAVMKKTRPFLNMCSAKYGTSLKQFREPAHRPLGAWKMSYGCEAVFMRCVSPMHATS
jgi:hypothetical protein